MFHYYYYFSSDCIDYAIHDSSICMNSTKHQIKVIGICCAVDTPHLKK